MFFDLKDNDRIMNKSNNSIARLSSPRCTNAEYFMRPFRGHLRFS